MLALVIAGSATWWGNSTRLTKTQEGIALLLACHRNPHGVTLQAKMIFSLELPAERLEGLLSHIKLLTRIHVMRRLGLLSASVVAT